MARIRTIKPEFPQSESIGKLSRDARLLYIQLWTIVDDAGRARAASRMLASLLYPYDDDARDLIDGWLAELEHGDHIRRYEVDGSQYLEVTKWLEHQKIDKPSKSRLPEFVETSRIVAKPLETSSTDLGPSTVDLGPAEPNASRSRAASPSSEDFENLRKVYPRRQGSYGWKAAERKFNALVKTGVDPQAIIAAASRLCETHRSKIGTEFIPMPASWLNSEDFTERAVAAFVADDGCVQVLDQKQLEAWDSYGRATLGKPYPRDRRGGWRFPSKWPPGYESNIVAGVEELVSNREIQ
jgi:hypothetical protein